MNTFAHKFLLGLIGLLLITGCVSAADAAKTEPGKIKHVTPKEAKQLIDDKLVVVLDVRTAEEYKTGHIAGATNIDFNADDFAEKISKLDTNKTYLVHCASGGRSKRCLPTLLKNHLDNLYHMDGGFNAWEKDALPVEK